MSNDLSDMKTRRRGLMVVLSSPSGAGKSTLTRALLAENKDMAMSVSATTRRPRPGEIDGQDYYFVDKEKFSDMIHDEQFLEHAKVFDNFYGTPRGPVEKALSAGRPSMLEIDLQGARQVRRTMPDALFVFLKPPSWDELVRRLVGRGTETEEERERRLVTAREELAAEPEFDVTIVNHEVRAAADDLVTLMMLDPEAAPSAPRGSSSLSNDS